MSHCTATLALFLAFLASVPAPAQMKDQPPAPIRPVDGATVFRNYCAPCHGLDGRGKGPVAEALKPDIPDLTTLLRRNGGKFPTAHVRNTIMFGGDTPIPAHGSKGMPIWGPIFHELEFDQDFGNVRLDNVTRHIESIQRK